MAEDSPLHRGCITLDAFKLGRVPSNPNSHANVLNYAACCHQNLTLCLMRDEYFAYVQSMVIWGPIVLWVVLKFMSLVKENGFAIYELNGLVKHSLQAKITGLVCLSWVPNALLIPIMSIEDTLSTPEHMVMHLTTVNNICSLAGIPCTVVIMCWVCSGPMRAENEEGQACCSEETCCDCIPAFFSIPMVIIWVSHLVYSFEMILLISFDFALHWPDLHFQGVICAFKIFVVVIFVLELLGNIGKTIRDYEES